MNELTATTTTPEQTVALGRAVAQIAEQGDVIALNGELGAGKTQFVRGLAMGLGIEPRQVSSPTFVLVHEYEPLSGSAQQAAVSLIHIDAYRLDSLDDLETIGWDRSYPEMRETAIIAIEWAERIAPYLGDDYLSVNLEHVNPTTRRIALQPQGRWCDRLNPLQQIIHAMTDSNPHANDFEATQTSLCSICGKTLRNDAPTFPFCSKRCRTIDLGRWADGSYTISRTIEQSDLEEAD